MNIENPNKKYTHDNTIVFSCQYHIVWATKYRRKVLTEEISNRMKELILTNQTEGKYKIVEMEIMPDHVHLLVDISPKTGIIKTLKYIKGMTSNNLRNEFPCLRSRIPCLWTRSKFISTVGSVSLETVKQYIENQRNV